MRQLKCKQRSVINLAINYFIAAAFFTELVILDDLNIHKSISLNCRSGDIPAFTPCLTGRD